MIAVDITGQTFIDVSPGVNHLGVVGHGEEPGQTPVIEVDVASLAAQFAELNGKVDVVLGAVNKVLLNLGLPTGPLDVTFPNHTGTGKVTGVLDIPVFGRRNVSLDLSLDLTPKK